MTTGSPLSVGGQLRVVLGVSRSRVLPLRLAYEADEHVRVVASCATASEALAVLERGDADGAVLDEDLHGLDRTRLGLLKARPWRLVLLSRQPESTRWDGLPGTVLHPESDPSQILQALQTAPHVEFARHRNSNQASANTRARSHASANGEQSPGSVQGEAQRAKSRVIGFWGGRGGAGKTTLCAQLPGAGRGSRADGPGRAGDHRRQFGGVPGRWPRRQAAASQEHAARAGRLPAAHLR